MTLVLLAVVAGALGAWIRRWWLLALPPAAALGAAFVVTMPGSRVNPDNPLLFLLILIEVFLAAGVILGKRLWASAIST